MSTLGNISEIEYHITHAGLAVVNALHLICYGKEGEVRKTRKALRKFAGFSWDKNSDEHEAKVKEVIEKIKLPDLIAVCNILDLNYEGSKEEIAERICSFLSTLEYEEDDQNATGEKEEETEDEDLNEDLDEDGHTNDGSEELAEENEEECARPRPVRKEHFSLTFRDVEDTIRIFDGKDDYPIQRWIEEFEEIAQITGWNDLQKLIFAKKSLTGLAKLFVQSEKGIKSWKILKGKLIKEFEVRVSSAQIHKMLMTRKKKYEESVQEYVLIMRELGSRGNIENEVVIQYIIDGISDDTANKIVLYGARNFSEFKEKIKLYETIAKKRPGLGQHSINKQKDINRGKNQNKDGRKNIDKTAEQYQGKNKNLKGEPRKEHCFNCGGRGHRAKECPDKGNGTKCFKCSRFGHLASQCTDRAPATKKTDERNVSIVDVVPKNFISLNFNEVTIAALFDTGSDISAVREDVYDVYFKKVPLTQDTIIVKGIGSTRVETLGSFQKEVEINNESFDLLFHVIPRNVTNFQIIVGNNLLEQAEVHIRKDGIVVCAKEKDNFLMNIAIEENKEDKHDIHVEHISDIKYKRLVSELIDDYKPEKTKTTDIKMKIILKSEEAIYQRPRRLSEPEKAEVNKQIEEWLREGIIKESSSDFASPIVLVRKKDGSVRICCDYRKLNVNIVKDRFPLPLIEDVMDKLEGARIFTTIDLRNGFFHVDVDESSTKYTSFVTPSGQYEFLKCPFGLCNSPAVFQRFISHIFRGLTTKNIMIFYMDDIVIPSSTYEEGIERLRMVLEVARDYGLEIKKSKCQFLKERVNFLGYIVENGKVQPSDEKTLAIKHFKEPTTCKQLQSFLGLTGYFRKFIPAYSTIAKPMSDMLRKDIPFKFGKEQQRSFCRLKELLTSYPVLNIFKRGLPTELHTDASMHGYGACLMQKSDVDTKVHPIYYLSKKTTPAEEKYTSYELEVLAIINAVKKFRIYLMGSKFKIVTDCSAFQKTMQKKDLSTRIARWALLLEEYEYEIEHRKGSRMSHVDALSRYPMVMTLTKEEGIMQRIKHAQDIDENIVTVKKLLNSGQEHDNYFIQHDIVYKYEGGQELLVIPKAMQTEVIKKVHEDGHFAVKKTQELIKREVYIPKLKEKIESVIANCIPCILGNRKEGRKEGLLHPIPKQEGPLYTYHADHLGPIPSTNKNYQHILAVIDDFTKFTWLYATKSTTARETVNCFIKQQKTFGNPYRIITDKGTAFTANEFKDYCVEQGIHHVTITTGVARGNGQIERIHRTVIPVLTKLSLDDPTKWYKYLDRVQRALNSTHQRSINTTPFEVLTGIKMRKKEDIRIKELIEEESRREFDENREELRKQCKENLLKVQEENKRSYNLRRKKANQYKTGDLVAIKRTQFGSGLKVNRKFLGPYEVTKVKDNERYDVVKVGIHEGPIKTSTCSEFMKPWIQCDTESETDS